MKVAQMIVLAIACSSATVFGAPPDKPVKLQHGFFKGNDYRAMAGNARTAYVSGMLDGFLFAPVFGADAGDLSPLAKCLTGMRSDQAMAIVDYHMTKHPEMWDADMNTIVYRALLQACADRNHPLR